ncbi:hypothetical protein BO82DRAFT_20035 [Aspergillus uvarum CBS 121591]|uniref:Uncharacterized protein n=1 Tax=Aspergillus uvarum CBS 121591 TaxID=1448315 RepID=A0A319BSD1_9EURO|nr:hypothetical protein BO82DRAFT_20035 [Aspergillus uvarum CBS 121591]PYH75585.1 hypothetical protein BO82DRAFT_20035 [Aspergillus uvarum CBS 121591]
MLFLSSFSFNFTSLFISVYHNSPGTSLGHACLLLGLFHFNSMIFFSILLSSPSHSAFLFGLFQTTVLLFLVIKSC